MPRKGLNKKILEKLLSNSKVKASEPVVRNKLSKIRRNNVGVTLNAAGQIYAESKGFSLMTYLDDVDRTSLQYKKSDNASKETKTGSKKIRVPKGINTNFGTGFENEANDNAKIYPYVYVLENSLRKIIMHKFKDKTNWWKEKKIVHPDIQKSAIKIQQAESNYIWMPSRGNHPIYYVGLWELFKIIETNWKDFKNIFKNLEDLRTWMKEMVSIRHLVAHNVKARKVDFDNAKIRTTHICTMISKSYSNENPKKI